MWLVVAEYWFKKVIQGCVDYVNHSMSIMFALIIWHVSRTNQSLRQRLIQTFAGYLLRIYLFVCFFLWKSTYNTIQVHTFLYKKHKDSEIFLLNSVWSADFFHEVTGVTEFLLVDSGKIDRPYFTFDIVCYLKLLNICVWNTYFNWSYFYLEGGALLNKVTFNLFQYYMAISMSVYIFTLA